MIHSDDSIWDPPNSTWFLHKSMTGTQGNNEERERLYTPNPRKIKNMVERERLQLWFVWFTFGETKPIDFI